MSDKKPIFLSDKTSGTEDAPTFSQVVEAVKSSATDYNTALRDIKRFMSNQQVEGTEQEIRKRYKTACDNYRSVCETGIESLKSDYRDIKITPIAENGFITGVTVKATPLAAANVSLESGRSSSSSSSSSSVNALIEVKWDGVEIC